MEAKVTAKTSRISALACIVLAAMLTLCLSVAFGVEGAVAAQGNAPVVQVTNVATGKLTVKKGATYALGVKASGAKVTYKSSKPSVVRVNSKGKIKALKTGKSTITVKAKANGKTVSKKILVSVVAAKKYKNVKSIKVKASAVKLEVGKSAKLTTTFSPKKASNKNLVYKTSNARVVKVSASGKVSAVGEGKAVVTVQSTANKKAKKSITFNVSAAKVAVASVSAYLYDDELVEGESSWVDAEVYPYNATDQRLTYMSSNDSVVSVDSDGDVFANSAGTAEITVRSVDNPHASDVVRLTVLAGEFDDDEEMDPDAIDPEDIDPDHDNLVVYSGNVTVVQDAAYTLADDGSVNVAPGVLPQGLVEGDVVAFEPTDDNPFGAAVKVDAGGAYDGELSGGTPEMQEVYNAVDVESYGVVEADAFEPAEGIELVDVEEVDLEKEGPDETTVIYPQGPRGGIATQSTQGTGLSLQAGQAEGVNAPGMLRTQVVSDSGKSTSKFKLKYKGVTFSVSLTGKVKYNYDMWGINELYVGVEAKNSLGIKGKLSDIFGAEDVDKELGRVVFATTIPGLSLEGSVWLHIGADGEVSFSLDSSCETGVRYTKSDGVKVVVDHETSPNLKASAELSVGLDFVGTLKLFAIDVADPSLDARFTLGVDSGDAKVRDNGMRCNDIKLKFAPGISIGTHKGLCKTLGISYSKNIASITLYKWHLENGNIVNSCTWKGNKRSYQSAGNLLPRQGGMGSWGGDDALRVTLSWGAIPRDLDSHIIGDANSSGEFHVYYGDKEYRDNGAVKAFLDIDDTEGYGYETTTVYRASTGKYHFYVHNYSGEDSLATSSAQVNVYRGNTLLHTYNVPSNASDPYWYVFTYDAATGQLKAYELDDEPW